MREREIMEFQPVSIPSAPPSMRVFESFARLKTWESSGESGHALAEAGSTMDCYSAVSLAQPKAGQVIKMRELQLKRSEKYV